MCIHNLATFGYEGGQFFYSCPCGVSGPRRETAREAKESWLKLVRNANARKNSDGLDVEPEDLANHLSTRL